MKPYNTAQDFSLSLQNIPSSKVNNHPKKFCCYFIFKLILLTHTFLSHKHCP